MRAAGQAGIRPNLNTEHQLFALRHLLEECHRRKNPMYACFIDFSKAYDCMPRALLWQVMQHIGVSTKILRAVQSMYAQVSCMVNIGGVVGGNFVSAKGVKQGCPLSPTLFGIFIDRFYFMHVTIHRTAGEVGP